MATQPASVFGWRTDSQSGENLLGNRWPEIGGEQSGDSRNSRENDVAAKKLRACMDTSVNISNRSGIATVFGHVQRRTGQKFYRLTRPSLPTCLRALPNLFGGDSKCGCSRGRYFRLGEGFSWTAGPAPNHSQAFPARRHTVLTTSVLENGFVMNTFAPHCSARF